MHCATAPPTPVRRASTTGAETPRHPAAPTPDPWVTIAQTALALLEEVAAASRASRSGPARDGLRFVQRDPDTGQEYLRIPLPSAEVVDRALDAVGQLLRRIGP